MMFVVNTCFLYTLCENSNIEREYTKLFLFNNAILSNSTTRIENLLFLGF
ncbi:MAG: Uncharacterised protein [Cryomorphaceae bacterium]|nr:MAG: Uncharacterised protein [Cryomorphaceae bacterium]